MKILIKTLFIGSLLLVIPGLGAAGEQTVGEKEYLESCAVCHGTDGTGSGPYAAMLTNKPADLTALTKRNRGVFPFNQVLLIIDGRFAEAVHGPRTMPVWGSRYKAKVERYFTDYYGTYDPEEFVKERILSLIGYLDTIQKK